VWRLCTELLDRRHQRQARRRMRRGDHPLMDLRWRAQLRLFDGAGRAECRGRMLRELQRAGGVGDWRMLQ
jgi:hypothetical protein